MTDEDTPFCVLLDANVWVAERLLQTSIGSAFLYALTASKATIGLPEIVEEEVNGALSERAEKAVDRIRTDISLLKQLSGTPTIYFTVPSESSIDDGIRHRWDQLGGLLIRVPFTHEHAKRALSRESETDA